MDRSVTAACDMASVAALAYLVVWRVFSAFPPDFASALDRAGVPILDLAVLAQSTLPYDVHPYAAGYRTIAAGIAASHLTSLAYGRATDRKDRDE